MPGLAPMLPVPRSESNQMLRLTCLLAALHGHVACCTAQTYAHDEACSCWPRLQVLTRFELLLLLALQDHTASSDAHRSHTQSHSLLLAACSTAQSNTSTAGGLQASGGSKTMDALLSLKCSRRILLTGTPVQNNLDELHGEPAQHALGDFSACTAVTLKPTSSCCRMFCCNRQLPICRMTAMQCMPVLLLMCSLIDPAGAAMVSFVCPGLLGTSKAFNADLVGPLSRRHDEQCSAEDRAAAEAAETRLQAVLCKCLLRRCASLCCQLAPALSDKRPCAVPSVLPRLSQAKAHRGLRLVGCKHMDDFLPISNVKLCCRTAVQHQAHLPPLNSYVVFCKPTDIQARPPTRA